MSKEREAYFAAVKKSAEDNEIAFNENPDSYCFGKHASGLLTLRVMGAMETPAIAKIKEQQPVFVGRNIAVNAFHATVGSRKYRVGFGVFTDQGPTLVCGAVFERLVAGASTETKIVIRLIADDPARKTVKALRRFTGEIMLIGYANEHLLDDGKEPLYFDPMISCQYDPGH